MKCVQEHNSPLYMQVDEACREPGLVRRVHHHRHVHIQHSIRGRGAIARRIAMKDLFENSNGRGTWRTLEPYRVK